MYQGLFISCFLGQPFSFVPYEIDEGVEEVLDKIKKAIKFYEDVISLPHKGEIARELRNEDDVFLLLLYSEMIGIPNPVFYYSLELYPYIIEDFHDWHLRMGMEKSPLSGIRCC